MKSSGFCIVILILAGNMACNAALIWTVGVDDNAWPFGDGGGPNATFVIESVSSNSLPGNSNSPEIDQLVDDDYYFAGTYDTQVDGGAPYMPLGTVFANEEAAERAFSNTDNTLRYHFNLPASVNPTDVLSFTFDFLNLGSAPDPSQRRYGVEVYFNNTLVMPEVVVFDPVSGHPNWTPGSGVALLDDDITTPSFTLSDINAANGWAGSNIGSGFDNYVELRGINYVASGGGNWMGVDYVQLDATPIPEPTVPVLTILAAAIALPLLCRRR